jgi:hypothetical protein
MAQSYLFKTLPSGSPLLRKLLRFLRAKAIEPWEVMGRSHSDLNDIAESVEE